MSTRSRIAYEDQNGNIVSVYCHNDGYLSGVGRTLFENYKTIDKVKKLVSLGDLSCVMSNITPKLNEKHSFDRPSVDVTVAYHRDRGEDLHFKTFDNEDDLIKFYLDSDQEYLYLFKDGQWTVYKDDQFIPLDGVLKLIDDDISL